MLHVFPTGMFKYLRYIVSCIIDIDECADPALGCVEGCVNIPGSYTCHCPTGYEFEPISQTCIGRLLLYSTHCGHKLLAKV